VNEYRELLGRADAWYREVQARYPEKVPCKKGCRECCLGLFDITLADRDLLREGLEEAEPAARRDIEARGAETLGRLRAIHPNLGETLDGWSADEIDEICDSLGDVECPVLGPGGECRLYEHRPLTCRLAGAPLVDVTGELVAASGCAKCTLPAAEAPRLDCGSLRRDERNLLRRRYRGESGVSLLIPQAVAPGTGAFTWGAGPSPGP
jgi:Fe-S-cluster containining protein